jgi:hypothetical protein
MTESAGIKLHKQVTTPLTTLYDGTSANLQTFMEGINQRSKDSGWDVPNGLLSISNQAPINPQVYNLITHHRMLSLDNVRAHAATYVGQHNRTEQDAYWMYEFIQDSLTDSARICLSIESDSYKVNVRDDGPCYLKVLLIKFHVKTNATNFHLRESLSLLPSKMKDLKSNIAKFNDHVSAIVVELAAGGETSSDLIVYVFRSYLSVEDQEFKR